MSNRPQRNIRRKAMRMRIALARILAFHRFVGSSRAKAYRPARGICSRTSGLAGRPIPSLATFEHLAG